MASKKTKHYDNSKSTIERLNERREIEKAYKKYGVSLDLDGGETLKNGRVRYRVKPKGKTRIEDVTKYAEDVNLRLRLHCIVERDDFDIYIVVADDDIKYPRLPKTLKSCAEGLDDAKLPYPVGYNASGKLIIADLAEYPHLMIAGATNSGKSVALKVMIASIAESKLSSEVNMVLVDVGAGDLADFDGLPHLKHPVIRDCETACRALLALKGEMERRIRLEHDVPAAYKQLPIVLLVIDEFPALVTGQGDKKMAKTIADMVSSLLQRGRHAKIHVVLAAQNPTYQNMKVDLGNITARIAFRYARENNSVTILGEKGAEKLEGKGSLLMKSPQNDGRQWLQGVYVKPKELRELVQEIKDDPRNKKAGRLAIAGPGEDSSGPPDRLSCSVAPKRSSKSDRLLADAIMWAVKQDRISINGLKNGFHLGWDKAAAIVDHLAELGIVDRPEGKVPREVLPTDPADIPEEMIGFLEKAGYSQDAVIDAFCRREDRF